MVRYRSRTGRYLAGGHSFITGGYEGQPVRVRPRGHHHDETDVNAATACLDARADHRGLPATR